MPETKKLNFTYSITTEDMKLRTKVNKISIFNAGNGNFWVAGAEKGPCSSKLNTKEPVHFSYFVDEESGEERAMLLNLSDKRLTAVIEL